MKAMDAVIGAERECTLLGTLFQYIITDLKVSCRLFRSDFVVYHCTILPYACPHQLSTGIGMVM